MAEQESGEHAEQGTWSPTPCQEMDAVANAALAKAIGQQHFNNRTGANNPLTSADSRVKGLQIPPFSKRDQFVEWKWSVMGLLRRLGMHDRVQNRLGNLEAPGDLTGSDSDTMSLLAADLISSISVYA